MDKVLEGQAQMMVELTNQRERTFRLAGKEQEQTVKIDGLESEIAIAPKLLEYGGGAPFEKYEKDEMAEMAEDPDAEGSQEEEEDGEVIHDRESLKKRADKIVLKKMGKGGRKKGRGDDY